MASACCGNNRWLYVQRYLGSKSKIQSSLLYYDVPHGKACAMLLPISMEFNRDFTGEKYREIARVFGVKDVDSLSQEEYRDYWWW